MAFDGKFVFEGKEFDLLESKIDFKREVDAKGRTSSHVKGVLLSCTVESTEDTSLIESATNEYKLIKGKFVWKKGDEDAKMKECEFEDGAIIKYSENFTREDAKPMSISLLISPRVMVCGGARLEFDWPKK